jgi:hypothetical protein
MAFVMNDLAIVIIIALLEVVSVLNRNFCTSSYDVVRELVVDWD